MKRLLLPLLLWCVSTAAFGADTAFTTFVTGAPVASAPAGTEKFPLIQSAVTKSITPAALATYVFTQQPVFSGDCTTPSIGSGVLTCTKTNGTAFGPAATIATTTGSGSVVLGTSPTLTTPALGTPSAINLSNATNLPAAALPALTGDVTSTTGTAATSVVKVNGAAVPTSALVVGTNSSNQLVADTTTGTGSVVLATSPTLVTPALGTPSALNLTNATALPATALPALTGDVTTTAGTAATTVVQVEGASIPTSATVVGTNGSKQLVAATTTGSGSTVVLATSPALTTPNLGTPSAVNLTNATSLPAAALPALTGDTTSSAGSAATTNVLLHPTTNVYTSAHTVTATEEVVECNSSSAVTLTLPAATGTLKHYWFKNLNTGTCTISRAGSDTIDGATSVALSSQYSSSELVDRATGSWDRLAQTILGGDLTGTPSNAAIAANAVTNAKAAQMAANTVKCNNTGSLANATDCTVPQTQALLSIPGTMDVQTFTASGTWTKPAGVPLYTNALCIGAGGGGGSGAQVTLGTAESGGGGGGGGGTIQATFATASLGATETVTIGTGGTAGAAVTAVGAGNPGGQGGASSFGTWIKAWAGGGGAGGASAANSGGGGGAGAAASGNSTTTATGGNAGTSNGSNGGSGTFGATVNFGGVTDGGAGGAGDTSGAAGSQGGINYSGGGAGGGAGGGLTISAATAGGNGGSVAQNNTAPTGGANTGANGGGGVTSAAAYTVGTGGAGGGGNSAGVGGTGGTGGRGSGGGGGGASAGGNSGAGGAGGNGYCAVATFY